MPLQPVAADTNTGALPQPVEARVRALAQQLIDALVAADVGADPAGTAAGLLASITKASIGLGNVANLAPTDLPVSAAQQAAIDQAVAGLLGGVTPADRDTIRELAALLTADETALAQVVTALAGKAPLVGGVVPDANLPARLGAGALSDSFAQKWTPDTAVLANAIRQAPTGETIKRTANGTTRPSYDATEAALWTIVGAAGGSFLPAQTDNGGKVLGTDGTSTSWRNLTSADITNFLEASQDVVGGMVAAAGGTYDDTGGTIGFPASSAAAAQVATPPQHVAFVSQAAAPLATYASLGMTDGNGVYAPCPVRVEGRIDNPINGAKYYMLCSTDHSQSTGGLYLLTASTLEWVNGVNPWTPYVGALPNKAVFYDTVNGTAGNRQTETPWIVWEPVPRLFFVYYQQAGVGGNQGTMLAVTPDFLTWEIIGLVFGGDSPRYPGDQHNGYCRPNRVGRNQWIAHHLDGGNNYFHTSISYSLDGVNNWRRDPVHTGSPNMDDSGDITKSVTPNGNFFTVGGQTWALGVSKGFTSGTAPARSVPVAGPVHSSLTRFTRPPQVAWSPRYAWEATSLDNNYNVLIDDDGALWFFYVAGDKTNGGIGAAKGVIVPMREAA